MSVNIGDKVIIHTESGMLDNNEIGTVIDIKGFIIVQFMERANGCLRWLYSENQIEVIKNKEDCYE